MNHSFIYENIGSGLWWPGLYEAVGTKTEYDLERIYFTINEGKIK